MITYFYTTTIITQRIPEEDYSNKRHDHLAMLLTQSFRVIPMVFDLGIKLSVI